MNDIDWKKDYIKALVDYACHNTVYLSDIPVFPAKEDHPPFGYIYITVLRCTGEVYIGQHRSNVYDPSYIGSGLIIQRARKKYSRDAFFNQPLEFANSQEELNQLEIEYVLMAKEIFGKKCMNLANGGFDIEMTHTDSAKKKSEQTRLEKYGGLMKQCHTPEAEARSARTHEIIYGGITNHMLTPEAKKRKDETFLQKYNSPAGALVLPETQEKAKEAKKQKYGTDVGRMHDPDVRAKAQEATIIKYGGLMAPCHNEEAQKKAFESRANGHNGDFMWMVHNPESQAKAAASRKGLKRTERAINHGVFNRLVRAGVYYKILFNNKKHYCIGLARVTKFLKCRDKAIRKIMKDGISISNYKYWKLGLRAIIPLKRPRSI